MKPIEGQYDIFGNIVHIEKPKPARQASKPQIKPKRNAVEYRYLCTTCTGTYIVWAQHERQAYAKCSRMHGRPIKNPELV